MSTDTADLLDNVNEQQINQTLGKLVQLKQQLGKVIVGQHQVIDQVLIALLAQGHCLLEGVPGLAKTLLISTLAKTMDLDFNRVQFTPDLMPSDIIGTEILETDHASGDRFFKFQQGPIFTQILLADEINRTPPKTQSALLEAMQERSISFAGKHYELPKPFFVLATQNPVEQAGTYSLPEAQLDRFLLFVQVAYPNFNEELEILKRTTGSLNADVESVINQQDILLLQAVTRAVNISDALLSYVASLVQGSRPQSTSINEVNQYVSWGAGPRASQALVLCAKAHAILRGEFSVTMQDIMAVIHPVLRHRLLLNFQAEAQRINGDEIIQIIVDNTSQPTAALN
ncbi:AAA family ATPase [Thalassotalea mangrovi]|uniref:MoxR family ATPase n=1 Tax=Thalassotalea mangrovi TaxID=2572245 RepID=A0A4U1B397_9GAMM|nr:MoxR family ATPase [Thalassotalea mangrovi]TKB44347.1 MoxR family ATPase [Thalassotalea mangrovi]